MTYGLYNDEGVKEDIVTDIRKIGENDLTSKRILSENWFDIDIKHFELYQLLYVDNLREVVRGYVRGKSYRYAVCAVDK